MKTHKQLYRKFCSLDNLTLAYEKAKKGKTKKESVILFKRDFERNLLSLQKELINKTYHPQPLKRFIIRDPKTRVIHASIFKDRIVHHALINIIEPIFEKIFIYDSFASRKNKGTHLAIKRFDEFKRKVSRNGLPISIKQKYSKNKVQGYCLKSDIKHYFDEVDHKVLLNILIRKIKDDSLLEIIEKILINLKPKIKGKGMPLGNYTSQFFANVYLNDLDYFVKS